MPTPTQADPGGQNDPFDLNRFVHAQQPLYNAVLAELKSGRKRTHWMWFVFPQVDGLGHSPMSKQYAIRSEAEARQYLDHPVLGQRLIECAEAILAVQGRSASEIFGFPDDMKLQSSMTLFAAVTEPDFVFAQVLNKYFHGQRDQKTLKFLASQK